MKQISFSKKRVIHIYAIIFIVIMLIIIAATLMFKYNIEGEKNLPFNLKEISVISTAESEINQDEGGTWHASALQKNDLYFIIGKNNNYRKEEAIKKITFNNFVITKLNDNTEINIYRPTTSINAYTYSEEYKVSESLEYIGGQSTNMETLQINNQGGNIGFSIIVDNLGEYILSENEKLPSDGRMLTKAGINENDIKFKVSFDFTIETESGYKFKSNIVLDLPTGNILENGVETLKDTELKEVIFKRF